MTSLRRGSPRVLIHNFFNYGHFLVYAGVMARWALARGFHVILAGMGLAGTSFERAFSGDTRVTLAETSPGMALNQEQARRARRNLAEHARKTLPELQKQIDPALTVLLTLDDFLHEGVDLPDFATPTAGVSTFGNRDHYMGFGDLYSMRLRRLLKSPGPLKAVLTLDEHHEPPPGPCGVSLVHLPDMYALPGGDPAPADRKEEQALAAFLERNSGPVIVIPGKFDQRKNSVWILRAVRDTPDASVAVLGERLPCREDREIDSILAILQSQGRAFVRWGFVHEGLIRMALGHRAVPFLALPYSCHYGSSGLQLMGLAHGKPSLVPDNGLMARRTAAHGLGEVFDAWSEKEFRMRFASMLEWGPAPYASSIARFMPLFSDSVREARFDQAAGLDIPSPAPPGPPHKEEDGGSAAFKALHLGLTHLGNANPEAALERLEFCCREKPGWKTALWRKALALDALDDQAGRTLAVRTCLERGYAGEADCHARAKADLALVLQDEGSRAEGLEFLRRALALFPSGPAHGEASAPGMKGPAPSPGDLDSILAQAMESGCFAPDTWQRIGAVLARSGEHQTAALAFREAFRLAPGEYDYLLNLSDVLRYARRFSESLNVLDLLETMAPDHHGLHHKRGQALLEAGRHADAMAHFLLEPPDSAHYEAARAWLRRAQTEG